MSCDKEYEAVMRRADEMRLKRTCGSCMHCKKQHPERPNAMELKCINKRAKMGSTKADRPAAKCEYYMPR